MQNRLIGFSVALLIALTPVFADTTGTSNSTALTVMPSNAQYVTPTTNQNAATSNISTQINNNNLGANSFGQGITCQAPQVALGGYGARQSTGVGSPDSDAGFSVEYLAPIGAQSTKSCQTLANEVVHQRQLDTQLTFIQKCADFARAGIVLDPQVYPELAKQCAGIRLAPMTTGSSPNAYPRNGAYLPTQHQLAARVLHISDFSPVRNSELHRIAIHRTQRVMALRQLQMSSHLNRAQRVEVAARLKHENEHLRAVIAEYQLENRFLQKIAQDPSWHKRGNLRARILSYND